MVGTPLLCLYVYSKLQLKLKLRAMLPLPPVLLSPSLSSPLEASLTEASPFRRAEAEGSRTGGGEVCVCKWDERRRERRAQEEIQ